MTPRTPLTPPRLPRGHEALADRLVPVLHDVPWTDREFPVREALGKIRLKADGVALLTVVAGWVVGSRPRGEGNFSLAIGCWDKATARQRTQIELNAWREANPAWAHNADHDPYPEGGVPPSRS